MCVMYVRMFVCTSVFNMHQTFYFNWLLQIIDLAKCSCFCCCCTRLANCQNFTELAKFFNILHIDRFFV